jgi:hypothetical protein
VPFHRLNTATTKRDGASAVLRGFADHTATYHYWDAGRLVISSTVVAMDNWMVSPRYDMRSLCEARVSPVDVFEDAIQGWILDYAAKLADLKEDAAGMAVMNLVVAYPETIECYRAGRDSKGELKRFFRDGMRGVFPELADVPDAGLNRVCDDLRTGLYHGSMLKGRVVLVPVGPAITYAAEGQVFTINPFAFLARVQEHFRAYIERLRAGGPENGPFMEFWQTRHAGTAESVFPASGCVPRPDEIVVSTAAPVDLTRCVRMM